MIRGRTATVEQGHGAREADEFWSALDPTAALTVAEAHDYVRRLRAVFPLLGSERVLDFGSGPGLVAAELAAHVLCIELYDSSPRMRRMASERCRRLFNARVLEPGEPLGSRGPFDLVLANSVVQYMTDAQVVQLLRDVRPALAPGGRMVISDVPAPTTSTLGELFELSAFAARERILLAVLRQTHHLLRPFLRQRRTITFAPRTAEALQALAARAGCGVEPLAAQLTHRAHRLAMVVAPVQT